MNRIIFLFFLLFSVNASFSQVVKVDLNWSQTHSHEMEGKVYPLRFIENQGIDNGLPYFFSKTKTNSTHQKVMISDIVTEQIPSTDLTYYKASFVQVAEDFIIEASVTDEAGLPFVVLHAVPIRLRNGVYERIVQFSYQLSPSAPFNQKDFVQNSVMKSGSGIWYKISVEKDGIYKIDKAFLESCGINTTGLNPAHIHIYGNGDGLLPEKNNLPRTDDLAENAIFVQGESDGVFNENDYILFHAWGPHRWSSSETVFPYVQIRNIYSDVSTYFININGNQAPLRIQTEVQNDNPADTTISSYDFRESYENDEVNLVEGGQRWYGELFDVELDRTFNFSIPNLDTAKLDFKLDIASNCPNNTLLNTIKASVNGQNLFTNILPINSKEFSRGEYKFSMINPPSSIALKLSVTRQSPLTLTYLDRIFLSTKKKIGFLWNAIWI